MQPTERTRSQSDIVHASEPISSLRPRALTEGNEVPVPSFLGLLVDRTSSGARIGFTVGSTAATVTNVVGGYVWYWVRPSGFISWIGAEGVERTLGTMVAVTLQGTGDVAGVVVGGSIGALEGVIEGTVSAAARRFSGGT